MTQVESNHTQNFFCRAKKAFNMFHKSDLETIHKILSEYKCAKNDDKFLSQQQNQDLYTMLYIVDYLIPKKRK